MGGDNCATLKPALPNITGSFYGPICINGVFSADGAFTAESGTGYATNQYGAERYTTIKFNAADYNPIYSADTVQPPTLQLIPQIKF